MSLRGTSPPSRRRRSRAISRGCSPMHTKRGGCPHPVGSRSYSATTGCAGAKRPAKWRKEPSRGSCGPRGVVVHLRRAVCAAHLCSGDDLATKRGKRARSPKTAEIVRLVEALTTGVGSHDGVVLG